MLPHPQPVGDGLLHRFIQQVRSSLDQKDISGRLGEVSIGLAFDGKMPFRPSLNV